MWVRWVRQMAEAGSDSAGTSGAGMGSVTGTGDTPGATGAPGAAGDTPPPAASGSSRQRDGSGRFVPAADGGEPTSLLDWRASFPDDIRNDPVMQQFPHSLGAAKTLISQQKMLGDMVRLPKDDAPTEDWEKYYERIGRPQTVDGYTYDPAQHLPDGGTIHPDFDRRLKAHAHANGWMPKQYQETIRFVGTWLEEQHRLAEGNKVQARIEGENALKKAFAGDWQQVRNEAIGFFEEMSRGLFTDPDTGAELVEDIQQSGLANNPRFVAAFSRAYRQLTEADLLERGTGGYAGSTSAESLRATRQTLFDKMMTGHATPDELKRLDAVDEQLYKIQQRQTMARAS